MSSAPSPEAASLRRSWLYVPCASDRKLAKSRESASDMLIYDLEDSVPPGAADKASARTRLVDFLSTHGQAIDPARTAVRVNAVPTAHFAEDIAAATRLPSVRTLVLPKVHAPADLDRIAAAVPPGTALDLVASIESARALWGVGAIAGWRAPAGCALRVSALLFAAEDFCADTGIVRTRSRLELLHARSQLALAARAFGLHAIDMVCVDYTDAAYLADECADGRRLGFQAKQAIHPAQVAPIHAAFAPAPAEIARAARIVRAMAHAHASAAGAVGLDDGRGGREMIDAPMLKQAQNTVRIARAAGLAIPELDG